DIDIICIDSQRPVQNRFLLGESMQKTITERNLLQHVAVARIEINGALQATHSLFLFALATLDVTLQLEDTGTVGEGFGSDFQFGEGRAVIEGGLIKVSGASQMCFTRL